MRERIKDKGRLEHIQTAIGRQIEGMRHVLVHGYYNIDPMSLWDTIECDIPVLKPVIDKLLSEYEDDE